MMKQEDEPGPQVAQGLYHHSQYGGHDFVQELINYLFLNVDNISGPIVC